MKKATLIAAVLFCSLSLASYAQMTDEQVIEYVKTASASGKSQEDISKELLLRGVTQEQAERIKARVQSQQGAGTGAGVEGDSGFGRNSGATGLLRPAATTPTTRRVRPNQNSQQENAFDEETGSLNRGNRLDDLMGNDEDGERLESSREIFGHAIFSGGALSFEPNENLATPETYQLGPGDQLLIEIFGYSEGSYNKTISPEGTINISQIGRVQLGGLTIKEAREKLRRALVSKYASVGGSKPNSTVSITLSNIRTIQVNVMGEVAMPGTFRLSPFATVFNALYNAGGVKENGSMRAIKVVRSGEEIATVDVYGYLFNGHSDSDITLREGDVVIVPAYVNLVQVTGNVKRPMFYELAEGETLSDLIQYAGGFANNAHRDDIRVLRQAGPERQIFTVKAEKQASFVMSDGDEVFVQSSIDRFANRIEVKGSVFRPGMYELGDDIATVRQLIRAAGGLQEDAFTGRAVLLREKEDLTFESLTVDLAGILSGRVDDILLRKNDILTIASNKEIFDPGTMTINGYVQHPGVFPYAANTTVEDLIVLAGGLLDGASTARVDVARRVVDPASLQPLDEIGETFSFPLKDGLLVEGGEHFTLQPYDVVSVRKSPAFRTQSFVRLEGEITFPGDYVLLKEGERASDLIKRAGGPTKQAFVRGGILTRTMSREEANVQNAIQALGSTRDTLRVRTLREGDTYTVGIELDKAIERPGSEFDPILREGDRIFVPELQNTVRISGNVLYPNTVTFVPGKSVDYYVAAAGGYGFRAKRSKTYIVYQNGNVRKVGSTNSKIEPGCEIIVPQRPERRNMSAGEVVSLGTSTASLAMMVVSLLNAIRK